MRADLGTFLCRSCDNRDSAYDSSCWHRPCCRRRPADRSDVQVQTSHLAHLPLIFLSFVSPLHLLLRLRLVDSVSNSWSRPVPALSGVLGLFRVHIYIHASSTDPLHDLIVCLSVGMFLSRRMLYGVKYAGLAPAVPSDRMSVSTRKAVFPVIQMKLERHCD